MECISENDAATSEFSKMLFDRILDKVKDEKETRVLISSSLFEEQDEKAPHMATPKALLNPEKVLNGINRYQ